MKTTLSAAAILAALTAEVSAHATFQSLYVDGTDFGAQCIRMPPSNSPVTNVASNDIVCNANPGRSSGKCPVEAGGTVTIEMHQQPGDRSCANEAIGGAHYGPVAAYLQSVSDATTATAAGGGWFKIFQDSWNKNPSGNSADDDYWGTKDLTNCCGLMDVPIPTDLADGDYLLRAEALALHTAGSNAGAQFYMSCYQITVSGGTGTASPATVSLPGAYSASDPGILINIHSAIDEYIAPGPDVYEGGTTKDAGSECTGCEGTCPAGAPVGTAIEVDAPVETGDGGGDPAGGCAANQWEQCGGVGWEGCTACSGGSCMALNEYYHQCQ